MNIIAPNEISLFELEENNYVFCVRGRGHDDKAEFTLVAEYIAPFTEKTANAVKLIVHLRHGAPAKALLRIKRSALDEAWEEKELDPANLKDFVDLDDDSGVLAIRTERAEAWRWTSSRNVILVEPDKFIEDVRELLHQITGINVAAW